MTVSQKVRQFLRTHVPLLRRYFPFYRDNRAAKFLVPALLQKVKISGSAHEPSGEIFEIWNSISGGHKWLHYFEFYERVFQPLRQRPGKFLEIGVFNGGSLALWKKIFAPGTVITGLDINPECARFDDPGNQIHVRIGSQADPQFLKRVIDEFGPFDFILDDGSHQTAHLITTFNTLFDQGLTAGGTYVVEDLHTNYWHQYRTSKVSFVDAVKFLIDEIHTPYFAACDERFFREQGAARIPEMSLSRIGTMIRSFEIADSIIAIHKRRVFSLPVARMN